VQGVKARAAQRRVLDRSPVGQQLAPALAPGQRGQPLRAQGGGHRLAVVALQEAAHARRVGVVQVVRQHRVFQPGPARVLAQRLGARRIQAAALGGGDGLAHGCIARRIDRHALCGRGQGQQQGQQPCQPRPAQTLGEQRNGGRGRHAVEYTQRA
jgi:hypothetical protein